MINTGYATDSRLYRFAESQVGVWLPIPLSARLDVLTEVGEAAWAPTRRKELLSALLLAAPAEARALAKTLARLRAAKVSDAFIGSEEWRFLYPPKSRGPRVQLALKEEWEEPVEEPWATPGEPISSATTYRIGMMVPWPLAGRLKVLRSISKDAGERTSRQELISALVLAAPTSGAALAKMLERYWHGTLQDAMIPGYEEPMLSARAGRDQIAKSTAKAKPKKPARRPKGPVSATLTQPKRVPVPPAEPPRPTKSS